MSASLRLNLVVSAMTVFVAGAVRPLFNAANNHAFGAEWSGRAAQMISLIVLASLPATAGLPTVAVVHVSKSLAANRPDKAAAFARISAIFSVVLTALCIGGALLYGRTLNFTALELAFVAVGIAAYSYWRLSRSLFFSTSKTVSGLKADSAAFVVAAIVMATIIALARPEFAVGAYVSTHVAFALFTVAIFLPMLRGGKIEREDVNTIGRYTALWFIATGISVATTDLSVLVLNRRAELALVGEFGVAVSILAPVNLASRIIELPLINELSKLGAQREEARVRELTSQSLHWLTIILLAGAGGLALLAQPILKYVVHVETPDVVHAFAVIAFGLIFELTQTPASNLVSAQDHPAALAPFSIGPFVAAIAVWFSPLATGVWSIAAGLVASYLVRCAMFSFWMHHRYRVELLRRPLKKLVVFALGLAMLWATITDRLDPFLAFAIFEVVLAALFYPDIIEMWTTLTTRRAPSPKNLQTDAPQDPS